MRALCLIRKEPFYRRDAFERGLRAVGFDVRDNDRGWGAESASDWLVIWNRQGDKEVIADMWERQGGTVIVAENGYLSQIDKTYYAISVHGHNGSGWFPVGDDERFSALGFGLKPWVHDDGHVLVIGQRGIGSRTMRSPPQWGEDTLKKIRAASARDGSTGFLMTSAKLRPHPGNFKARVPLADDLRGASSCVIWSSAAGVRALVEGVPVFRAGPRWICSPSAQSFAHFPLALTADSLRDLALHQMSHGQWHHTEIATGEPFARIIANRETASW